MRQMREILQDRPGNSYPLDVTLSVRPGGRVHAEVITRMNNGYAKKHARRYGIGPQHNNRPKHLTVPSALPNESQVGFPKFCRAFCYPSRSQAKHGVRELVLRGKIREEGKELAEYWCVKCESWHVGRAWDAERSASRVISENQNRNQYPEQAEGNP